MGSDPAWVKATRAESRAAMVRCRKGWVVPEIPQTPECQAATRSCQLNVAMQAEQGLGSLEIRAGKGPRSMRHRERSAAATWNWAARGRQKRSERERERSRRKCQKERARAHTHTLPKHLHTHPSTHTHREKRGGGGSAKPTRQKVEKSKLLFILPSKRRRGSVVVVVAGSVVAVVATHTNTRPSTPLVGSCHGACACAGQRGCRPP